jgi:hypothetical protein
MTTPPDGTLTPKNLYYKSSITFNWDKANIEFITGKKFTTQSEFVDYISDTSVDIIKANIETGGIYWLVEIEKQ